MQKKQNAKLFSYISHFPTHFSHSDLLLSFKKSKKATMALAPLLHSKLPSLQLLLLISIFIFCSSLYASDDPPLSLDYYASTCPAVFDIIRKEMECEVLSDPRNAALVVRLHFHDCFVQVTSYSIFFPCVIVGIIVE